MGCGLSFRRFRCFEGVKRRSCSSSGVRGLFLEWLCAEITSLLEIVFCEGGSGTEYSVFFVVVYCWLQYGVVDEVFRFVVVLAKLEFGAGVWMWN